MTGVWFIIGLPTIDWHLIDTSHYCHLQLIYHLKKEKHNWFSIVKLTTCWPEGHLSYMMIFHIFFHIYVHVYQRVTIYSYNHNLPHPLIISHTVAIEHGHVYSLFSHKKHGGSFHSDVNVYQRVYLTCESTAPYSHHWIIGYECSSLQTVAFGTRCRPGDPNSCRFPNNARSNWCDLSTYVILYYPINNCHYRNLKLEVPTI